jgi:hypothetical protein
MVVFVDLEGDEEELQDIQQRSQSHHALTSQHLLQKLRLREGQQEYSHDECHDSNQQENTLPATAERLNPNIDGFSAALSCYP